MPRVAVPRLLGLVVAVAVLAAATQLLLISFEATPLFSTGSADNVSDWIRDRPSAGAAVLSGAALCVVALWTAWLVVRGRRSSRPSLVTRRRNGTTRLDRSSLEAALERDLAGVDRRVDARVRVRRRRAHLTLVTPDPSRSGSPHEFSQRLEDICQQRSLPLTVGRVDVTTPRRNTRSRTIR